MKQINNGYADYYYLTTEGDLYNAETKRYSKPDARHCYKLKTLDNKYKSIALKPLYRLVYNNEFCIDDTKDLEGEIWKEIERTNSIYYVSNKGRIKSYKGYKALVLNPYQTRNGYDRVDIIQDGSRRSCLVHRLVGGAFLPAPESIDYQLHHKDFNKNNSEADNLEWLTPAKHLEIHRKRRETIKNGGSTSTNTDDTQRASR